MFIYLQKILGIISQLAKQNEQKIVSHMRIKRNNGIIH